MLNGLATKLRLEVSAAQLRLFRVQGWRRVTTTLLAKVALEPAANGSALVSGPALDAGLQTLFGQRDLAGSALQVVLADALTRLWHVTPPPGAMQLADLRAAAAARFQTVYGEPVAGWHMQAHWDVNLPFVAVALPETLLALLRDGASRQRLALVSVAPHFICAWNRWCGALQSGAWFGVIDGSVLTLGIIDGARLHAVRTLLLVPDADLVWLHQRLVREAHLLELAPPQLLQVSGQVPPAFCLTPASGQIACRLLERMQSISHAPLALAGGAA